MIEVLVVGGKGKMGSLTAATIAAQSDLRLAAIVDPNVGGAEPVPAYASLSDALAAGTYDAAVEFSLPASVFENTRALLAAGVPTVVGATGPAPTTRSTSFARSPRRAASAASSRRTSPSAPCS